jgi:GNAT superfamily N-acetyltransferase
MTIMPAGTRLDVTVTYLEMSSRPGWVVGDLPAGYSLILAKNAPVWFFLSLYGAVGHDYEWRDRFDQAKTHPDALHAFVHDPKTEIWVLYHQGWPAGFFMLDWRGARICDLAYFGLVPQAMGRGIGKTLLQIAIAKGWAGGDVQKMTINTCTLDHPRALGLYAQMGFVPVRQVVRAHDLSRDYTNPHFAV